MRQWPSVNKRTHPLRRNPNGLFVTVECKMYCGAKVSKHDECTKNLEFSTKDRLHNDVDQRARHHIRNCNKCKAFYGES